LGISLYLLYLHLVDGFHKFKLLQFDHLRLQLISIFWIMNEIPLLFTQGQILYYLEFWHLISRQNRRICMHDNWAILKSLGQIELSL